MKAKKFLSKKQSYWQLKFKELETNNYVGFNQEKQIFIIVFSLEKNLDNTVIFTKLCNA